MKANEMVIIFLIVVFSLSLVGLAFEGYEKSMCKQKGLDLGRNVEEILRICR
jgi:hypothetical protein